MSLPRWAVARSSVLSTHFILRRLPPPGRAAHASDELHELVHLHKALREKPRAPRPGRRCHP
eukprot:10442598-Heterocapsa_arctica.AAC.1